MNDKNTLNFNTFCKTRTWALWMILFSLFKFSKTTLKR